MWAAGTRSASCCGVSRGSRGCAPSPTAGPPVTRSAGSRRGPRPRRPTQSDPPLTREPVTILERTVPLAEARRADLWAPRTDVVIERSVAPGVFEAATGPFARYERRVEEDPTHSEERRAGHRWDSTDRFRVGHYC